MKIYVAGATGLAGSAIHRRLQQESEHELITVTHHELDLTKQEQVDRFFTHHKPDAVILAAAKVGGILANSSAQGDFIRDNLLIQTHVIDAAYRNGVTKFCFLGSSCIYPKNCPQPIKEEYLLGSDLEKTNRGYAIAKIAGLEMVRAYRDQFGMTGYYSLMPTNLFGERDNFDLTSSHVFPALIRKFVEAERSGAKEVVVWGSGKPEREFISSDDLAEAVVQSLKIEEPPFLMNVGTGKDISIKDLAVAISEAAGYKGEIIFDATKPDGVMKRVLDVSLMQSYGLGAKISLKDGIRRTVDYYRRTYP